MDASLEWRVFGQQVHEHSKEYIGRPKKTSRNVKNRENRVTL